MDFDDFNPSSKQIAAGMAVVFLLITGLNALVAPDGGYAGDIADSVTNVDDSDSTDQASDNGSEDDSDPYFDKATGDDSSSDDGSEGSGDSGSLNETEQTQIENDFEGYVNTSERKNGIYLDRRAVAGESNAVQVMDGGSPVEGAEVLVNGESVGSTGPTGTVFFQVPQAESITLSTSTENLGSVDQSYEVTG